MNNCFFYVILTCHYVKYKENYVQLLGYGITINPKKRSMQYSDHSGVEQEFCNLYYGSTFEIRALESIIKQRVASNAHKIYGEPVEWISPKSSIRVNDLISLINDTINQENFKIHSLKDDYLPFNNLDHHRKITIKHINANPSAYLELK